MPVSDSCLDYVRDQLHGVGRVTIRKMFGGAGLYLQDVMFALIAEDILYFKVDDTNRPDFEAAGMRPFKPFDDKAYTMSYYQVPAEVLEDATELRVWAGKALRVALSKSRGTRKRRG